MKIITDITKLSQRASEINIKENYDTLAKTVDKLKRTLAAHPDVHSLCAPQIGRKERVFCINFKDGIKTFVNPIISKAKGLKMCRETCASIPGKEYIVPRNAEIWVIYQKQSGALDSNKFEGMAAEIFQYQINLLDGVLLSDIGLEIDENFDKASEDEKAELIDFYLGQLKLTNNELQQEIENDKELKKISDAIKFMEGVQTGEIQQPKPQIKLNRAQKRALNHK